jgi:hypothetical protein
VSQPTIEMSARFATAQDARRAINALERMDIEAAGPVPSTPVNGRPWLVTAQVPTESMSVLYPKPVLADKFATVVLQFNGTTKTI